MSRAPDMDGKPRRHAPAQGAFDPPAPALGPVEDDARRARLFRRGPWETAATILIALGVVMLMQPFALVLYTWSFLVTLVGTVGFIVVSHFPD